MFDRPWLLKFKTMFPNAVRGSAEAKPFLDFVNEKTKIDAAPFERGDQHVGWQAYGNVLAALRGADIALVELMFAFSVATRADAAASFPTVSAIASSIAWVQTNYGRFDELLAFVQGLNARYPGNLFVAGLLVKCRMVRGEVEHAESLVRTALSPCASFEMARDFVYWSHALFNQHPLREKLETLRRNYPTLWQNSAVSTVFKALQGAEHYGRTDDRKDASAVYCMNLPDDKGRWRRVEAAFAKLHLRLSRIDGVRADHLPMAVRDGFAARGAQAGQVGCFLAHLKAWEALVNHRDAKALIIEDDALPMFGFSLASILDALPEDADVAFVNLRSNPMWRTCSLEALPSKLEYIPIDDVDPSHYGENVAIGTDGYIVSARGAKKLIALTMHTKMLFQVDWQIFLACLRKPFANKNISAARTGPYHEDVAKMGRLNGYVLNVPLIQELALDYSPRRLHST